MFVRDPIELSDLRLEEARALLRHGGHDIDLAQPGAATRCLQQIIDALCELSSRDALTGLANVRQLHAVLNREIDRVARTGTPMTFLLIDVDHFKSVNDTYGHQAGDQVLRCLASRLEEGLRPMDMAARYGGEEFAVILPNCLPIHGRGVAERIRRRIAATPIELNDSRAIGVTVSIGCAAVAGGHKSGVGELIAAADLQLYSAKKGGRNRVAIDLTPEAVVSAQERAALLPPGS